MPRIAFLIDGYLKKGSGIGTYIQGLLKSISLGKTNHEYIVISALKYDVPIGFDVKIIELFPFIPSKSVAWFNYIPMILNKMDIDLIINLSQIPILPPLKAPQCMTLHDINPILNIPGHPLWRRIMFKFFLPLYLKRMKRIFVDTENVVNVIKETFQNKNYLENLRIIPPCIFKDPEKARKKTNTIITVGSHEPWKNHITLIKALKLMDEPNNLINLIMVGRKGRSTPDIIKEIEFLGLWDRVRLMDFVDNKELWELYYTSKFMVLPSLAEGFSFPAIEAMSAGCPVLANDIKVFREVLGNEGVFVDAKSPEKLASAISELYKNGVKCEIIAQNGIKQVNNFTPDKTRNVFLNFIDEILG